MERLDMTGQPCPIPMVEAKKILAQPQVDGLEVLVDNIVATQNLEKMARGLGYGYACDADGDAFYRVTLLKNSHAAPAGANTTPQKNAIAIQNCSLSPGSDEGVTVLVTADSMGRGEEELGRILIKGFLFSLTELDPTPRAVIFLNSGAQLTSEGANTVADLETLQAKGCEILTCGTCANYYGITDKLAVGTITDMMGITSRIAAAARLVTI